MKTLRKDKLRESIEICKQSDLYYIFTREEKREAVMHVYSIINESQFISEDALGLPGELQSVYVQA
jgi:hypothetical protein